MSEYMSGPYNNRSTYEINVDALDMSAVNIAVTRTSDTVTVTFLNSSDQKIVSFDIPGYDGSAGALTQAIYTALTNAVSLINSHASDDSVHLSAEERAKLDAVASQFGLGTNIPLDIDPTYVEPTSGLTLQVLLETLAGNDIALKTLIQNDNLDHLESVVATKADKKDTYTKDETDDLLDDKADQDDTYTKDEVDDLLKTAGNTIGTADTGYTGPDSVAVTWRTESHTETVNGTEKTWVRAMAMFPVTAAITSVVDSTLYEYCASNVLGEVSLPCTFESRPQIYLGVQHNVVPSNTQGTGVWAVLSHAKKASDGTDDYSKLPTVRLQCASYVSSQTYYISVTVEGYKAS